MKNLAAEMLTELNLKEFKEKAVEMKNTMEMIALTEKWYYDALIKAGFKPDQAIALVSMHGVNVGMAMNLPRPPQDNQEPRNT